MKHLFLVLATYLVASLPIAAQKDLKQIRTAMKSNNPASAVPLVDKAKKDSTLMNNPQLYFLAAQVQEKLCDVQNVKNYLKQAFDTVAYFNSLYGIFDNLIKCDELESIPDKKGRVRPKSRKKIHSILERYYPNLYGANVFFMRKKQYQQADQFCSMYINTAQNPIFIADSLLKRDAKMPRVAFWDMTSCFELKNYQGVFKYEELVKRDTANLDLALRYKAMAYSALNDHPNMVRELKNGVRYMSRDLFFFSNLADYYNKVKDYASGMQLCDSLIKADTAQIMYQFAKSVVLFHLKKYDECRAISTKVIAKDPSNADANYYMASSYFNEGTAIDDNIKADFSTKDYNDAKAKVKTLFEASLPYMEQYRKMRPDDASRWAAPLYRMYLFLNKGQQFAEMDALLKKAEQEKQAAEEKAKAEAAKK